MDLAQHWILLKIRSGSTLARISVVIVSTIRSSNDLSAIPETNDLSKSQYVVATPFAIILADGCQDAIHVAIYHRIQKGTIIANPINLHENS